MQEDWLVELIHGLTAVMAGAPLRAGALRPVPVAPELSGEVSRARFFAPGPPETFSRYQRPQKQKHGLKKKVR